MDLLAMILEPFAPRNDARRGSFEWDLPGGRLVRRKDRATQPTAEAKRSFGLPQDQTGITEALKFVRPDHDEYDRHFLQRMSALLRLYAEPATAKRAVSLRLVDTFRYSGSTAPQEELRNVGRPKHRVRI